MRADLLASLAAICLYPLLLVIPGYVIGWLTGMFAFRWRTPAFRFALSIPLSISTSPVLIYLIGRFASMKAAEGVLAATWICFAVLAARRGVGWPRIPAAARWIVLGWLAIALFTSVDLEIGAKDYYPVTAFDLAIRSEFIHSIGATGIPPANPFFFPGHPFPCGITISGFCCPAWCTRRPDTRSPRGRHGLEACSGAAWASCV